MQYNIFYDQSSWFLDTFWNILTKKLIIKNPKKGLPAKERKQKKWE